MEYIIGVILLMLLFALPDALRHKRRYPHRGKRRSSPMDTTKPGQRTKQGPAPKRAPQQGQAKRRVPEKPRTARPAKGAPVPEDTGRAGKNLFPCGIENNDTATGRLLAAVFPLR